MAQGPGALFSKTLNQQGCETSVSEHPCADLTLSNRKVRQTSTIEQACLRLLGSGPVSDALLSYKERSTLNPRPTILSSPSRPPWPCAPDGRQRLKQSYFLHKIQRFRTNTHSRGRNENLQLQACFQNHCNGEADMKTFNLELVFQNNRNSEAEMKTFNP